MSFEDDLLKHLRKFPSAPFLFIGSGMSRRYLGLPGWEELLRSQAEVVDRPYEYFQATADGDFPQIASLIAEDLHEVWWNDPSYKRIREEFKSAATGPQSALKIEVARSMREALNGLPKEGLEREELELLKLAVIDGVITTNYDPLIEHLFPEFASFVGQDQMLFSHPQGIGEIYKIHGSHEVPDSLVLTSEDYTRFDRRNPYLAAKLLTIFVEHPVIFLGYSLTDKNVSGLLTSIASALTNDRIEQLQDRLIFVEWDSEAKAPSKLIASPFMADGHAIPILRASVADYRPVFSAMSQCERRFPARVLRQLKESVYELVRTNDPKERLYVQDLEPGTDVSKVEVVIGVGLNQQRAEGSYKGLGRDDLIDDVLVEGTHLDARKVVEEVLPRFAITWHAPAFKYLRQAGFLEDDGSVRADSGLPPRIVKRVEMFDEERVPPKMYLPRIPEILGLAGDFKTLAANAKPFEVLLAVGQLEEAGWDPAGLRQFLLDNPGEPGDGTFRNEWRRAVCVLDWWQYGRRRKPIQRRKRARPSRMEPKRAHRQTKGDES